MGYGPRTWGVIDNKGKFKRCTYTDFLNYCENMVKDDNLIEKVIIMNAVKKAWDMSFDLRPAYVGINDKDSYVAMWNVYDKEGTYKKFTF